MQRPVVFLPPGARGGVPPLSCHVTRDPDPGLQCTRGHVWLWGTQLCPPLLGLGLAVLICGLGPPSFCHTQCPGSPHTGWAQTRGSVMGGGSYLGGDGQA